MTLERIFQVCFAGLLATVVTTVIGLVSGKKGPRRLGRWILILTLAALTTYITWRWVESGRAPFSNMFESLVLFSWSALLTGLVFQMRFKLPFMDPAAAVMALLSVAYASFAPDIDPAIKPLMPALQSNWLTVHVITCFFGYAGFAIAFLLSIGYLFSVYSSAGRDMEKDKRAELDRTHETMEVVTAKLISFGFLFLSLGIVTGAVWANRAWGTYWSWDPKETWSLVTWLVYAVLLHCHFMRGWGGKTMAWMSVVGFICVMFTFFGVNYLPIFKGLHSYA